MAGWISVHRSITDHWLWSMEEFSKAQAWIDLLLHACHKPNSVMLKGKLYQLKRGQQARSMLTLSKEWKWSRGKVKRFIDALENDSMIEQQTDTITTIITICNYDSFQGGDTTDGTTVESTDDTTDSTQTIRSNNKISNKETWDFEKCRAIWNEVKSDSDCPATGCNIVPSSLKSGLLKVHKAYVKYCKDSGKDELERHDWFRAYAAAHLRRCSSFVGKNDSYSWKPSIKDLGQMKTFEALINQ